MVGAKRVEDLRNAAIFLERQFRFCVNRVRQRNQFVGCVSERAADLLAHGGTVRFVDHERQCVTSAAACRNGCADSEPEQCRTG